MKRIKFIISIIGLLVFFTDYTSAQRNIDIYNHTIEYNNGEYESMICDVRMSFTKNGKVYIGKTLMYTLIFPTGPYYDRIIWQVEDREGIECKLTMIDIDGYSRKIIISYSNLSIIYFGTEE